MAAALAAGCRGQGPGQAWRQVAPGGSGRLLLRPRVGSLIQVTEKRNSTTTTPAQSPPLPTAVLAMEGLAWVVGGWVGYEWMGPGFIPGSPGRR